MKRLILMGAALTLLLVSSLGAIAANGDSPIPAATMGCPGCCSSHGGITSICGTGGRILCNDGTTSPSCSCSSCGVSSTPSCSSYTYSAWSGCQPGGFQARSVTGSFPPGCVGTPGPLTQSCTYVAPIACTFVYSNWSACLPSGTQTRSVVSSSPPGCTGTPGPLSQTCAYTAPGTSAVNYTGMWWNPTESGWGINFNHQDSTVFATLFTYASSGVPMWLVGANLAQQSDGTFSGALYEVKGPAYNAMPWTSVTVTQVGTMTVSFTANQTATIVYNVGATSVTKSIQKEIFATSAPTCTGGSGSRAALTNYQDMWWNPAESGWGINLTHQGATIFAVLFTYDATGRDWWLVASNLEKQGDGSFSGALYATTGPGFSEVPWSSAAVGVTTVGSMTLRFANGESGTLIYTVNGVTVSKSIQREVFGTVVPVCQ